MTALSVFVESNSAWIGFVILALVFAAFISERLAPVTISLVGASVMLALGYLPRSELQAVFGNPAPLTIGAMFVLSAALVRTGVIEALASIATRRAERTPKRSISELLGGTFFASALVNNTPVVIVLAPIVRRIAAVAGSSAQRLLIPLSYLSIMGGSLTLLGSSTNLIVDGVAQRAGEAPFGIFELTGIGLIAAGAGIGTLLLLGRYLLPDSDGPMDRAGGRPIEERYLTRIRVRSISSWVGRKLENIGALQRSGVRLLAIRRSGHLTRNPDTTFELAAGDELVVAADQAELLGLSEELDADLGLAKREIANSPDDRIVEASIGPSHPAIGQRLTDIPFLNRSGARVLGVSRSRHLPGPTLETVRVRPADQFLIRCPPEAAADIRDNVNLIDIDEPDIRPYRRYKAPIAIATMFAIIALAAFQVAPIDLLAILGVTLVLVTRCIDPEEAWHAIEGNVIVLIFGMLAIGLGLQGAGTVDLIVDAVQPALTVLPIFLVLILVYALTSFLTEVVTNNAVAVIMTPIVIDLANSVGVDTRALLLVVMFAASASFATPIGYQTNTIVYATGGYRFVDFLKIGLPMNVVVGLATCVTIWWIYV
ncbi:SLC13 family permease [Erythrobacter rubeus]|uniref:SLC13 family permease n=1 Tax=Erythrobacter rubeus TaxID=2760803 RepID=A0ABR8KS10_9SPHN|nr:SLC13 family permease [Erythrobacter rubeus]MBD2843534.1 SLC13 family permease [Erythrobacter rubeus]